jgi:hypothetical protein
LRHHEERPQEARAGGMEGHAFSGRSTTESLSSLWDPEWVDSGPTPLNSAD